MLFRSLLNASANPPANPPPAPAPAPDVKGLSCVGTVTAPFGVTFLLGTGGFPFPAILGLFAGGGGGAAFPTLNEPLTGRGGCTGGAGGGGGGAAFGSSFRYAEGVQPWFCGWDTVLASHQPKADC